MKKLFLFLFLITTPALAADNVAPYYVPPTQFNAEMQIMDRGFANSFALFRIATGAFSFDDTAKSISNLRIAVDTTSMIAGNDAAQRDLSNMLSAFQYPEIRVTAPDSITFTDNKAVIKTTVTLHGASKPISFDAVLNRSGKSKTSNGLWAGEGEAVGISLSGTLKRADFGLTDSPDLPARFGDSMVLRLEMQGLKQ